MNQSNETPQYNDEPQWNRWREVDEPLTEQPTVARVYQFSDLQAHTVTAMVVPELYASGHDYPRDMPFTD